MRKKGRNHRSADSRRERAVPPGSKNAPPVAEESAPDSIDVTAVAMDTPSDSTDVTDMELDDTPIAMDDIPGPVEAAPRAVDPDSSPMDVLFDYERRAAEHVAGAAEQVEAPGLWRGIGFRLGERLLLSGIHEVNEILQIPPLTLVPGTKPWLLGVANVRGNLVAVVDLRGYLEGGRTPIGDRSRLLLARQPGGTVGLLVDEVLGQRNLTDENVPLDEGEDDERYEPFVPGRYDLGGTVWGIFRMTTLVKMPDFVQAAA